MSKADKRAKERYWLEPNNIETQERYAAYVEGYHQAEKDLELTWEDIPKIFQISEELKTSWWFRDNEQTKLIGTQVFWEEVLKRFKKGKRNDVSYNGRGF